VIITILLFLLAVAGHRWFVYYCALRGLMHHYGMKFSYMPDDSELKEITNQAMKRVISDFFRLNT